MKFSQLLLLLLLGVVSMNSCGSDFKLKKGSIIHVEMEVIGASAELYLNGIPIAHKFKQDQDLVSIPAMEYLIDNTNTLKLVVGIGSTPNQVRSGNNTDDSKPSKAIARMIEYPVDVFPGDPKGKPLIEIHMTDLGTKLPHTLKGSKDLGSLFGPRSWQSAEILKLDEKLNTELTEFVKKAYEAYKAGDADYLAKIASIQFKEGAQSYHFLTGEDAQKNIENFSNDLKNKVKDDFWKFSPFNPEHIDFRIVADGRMIECIDKNWQPLVKSDEFMGMTYSFPMFISKINGKFEVVR